MNNGDQNGGLPESPGRTRFREPDGKDQGRLFTDATLYESPRAWEEHWWGMPSYTMGDARPSFQIVMSFYTWEDVVEFARRLELKNIHRSTSSAWFPPDPDSETKPRFFEYVDEKEKA